jgi:L-ascorbate metabolism protein UlaG (beta-lactamase superfamily)
MAPTVFHSGPYRYFFFSREEQRMHVHVEVGDGEAKFWLEPVVALADFRNLKRKDLVRMQSDIEERADDIKEAWKKHFKR